MHKKSSYFFKTCYLFVTVAMLFCLSLSFERRAQAYIDPGSGLLMLQAAGTVMTGVLFTLRRRIKALLFGSKPTQTTITEGTDPTTEI